ncbi:hypothetical protein SLE2022_097560 [Rubroshorea leprosula]
MVAFSCTFSFPVRCSYDNSSHEMGKKGIKNNGTSNGSVKFETLKQTAAGVAGAAVGTAVASLTGNAYFNIEQIRQRIPTKKQLVDLHRHGLIIERGVGYRQTVVIRSYEVGPDKTATLECILNLFQETALTHVWMSGLLSNGFGATYGMVRNNLIWVVSRMQVQVDHYPIWERW